MVQIYGSGTAGYQNTALVDDSGQLLVSAAVTIGSVLQYEVAPNDVSRNNPLFKFKFVISGTSTGVTGSQIGSLIQFIGTGSFVQVLSYSGNRLTQVGSWS